MIFIAPEKVKSLTDCLIPSDRLETQKRLILRTKIKKASSRADVEKQSAIFSMSNLINDTIPSIEYEMDSKMVEQFRRNGIMCKNDGSSKIYEPMEVIPANKEKQMYALFKDTYMTSFPSWYHDMVSGGTHLHLHFPAEFYNELPSYLNTTAVLFATNFWMKAMQFEDWWKFYNRGGKNKNFLCKYSWNNYAYDYTSRKIPIGRAPIVWARTTLTWEDNPHTINNCVSNWNARWLTTHTIINSLEFRLNNVVHINIVWYYRVVLLIAKIMDGAIMYKDDDDIDYLVKISKKMANTFAQYLKEWSTSERINIESDTPDELQYLLTWENNIWDTYQRPLRFHITQLTWYHVQTEEVERTIQAISNIEKKYLNTNYFEKYIQDVRNVSALEQYGPVTHTDELPDDIYLAGLQEETLSVEG